MSRTISSMVDEQVARSDYSHRSSMPPPMVQHAEEEILTISRTMGSGARVVAERVAIATGWELWGKRLLDSVAGLSALSPDLVATFDERRVSELERFIRNLGAGDDIARFDYGAYLRKAIGLIATRGQAIIVGRGANFLLPQAMHIRIDAPVARRVSNLARYDGLSFEAASERVRMSDASRHDFLVSQFGKTAVREVQYDLSLWLDTLSVDDAVAIILSAVEAWLSPKRRALGRALART